MKQSIASIDKQSHIECTSKPHNPARDKDKVLQSENRVDDIECGIEEDTSISQEEGRKPFRHVLHQNSCWRSKISEENLEHG